MCVAISRMMLTRTCGVSREQLADGLARPGAHDRRLDGDGGHGIRRVAERHDAAERLARDDEAHDQLGPFGRELQQLQEARLDEVEVPRRLALPRQGLAALQRQGRPPRQPALPLGIGQPVEDPRAEQHVRVASRPL